MDTIIVSLLFLAALAGAWYLGKRQGARSSNRQSDQLSLKYFRGINFLLNESPDETVDALIESLEVTPETLDTHLAIGNLMRRKGEVERAIRIHQNLLSRPNLSKDKLQHAQLELARDFMKAGLLDRAERLMLDVVEMSPEFSRSALQHLIEIYRDEHEWEKAIRAASRLQPVRRFGFRGPQPSVEQAHFCCELAELALARGEHLEVRRQLESALKYDKNSVRASLLLGRLEAEQGNHRKAYKQFNKIIAQDPDYLPEAIEDICMCFEKSGRENDLLPYLQELYKKHPGTSLLLALTDKMRCVKGEQAAADYLAQELRESPSLKGVLRLLQSEYLQGSERRRDMALATDVLCKLVSLHPAHRCQSCGFSGRELHWLCPTCKSWGTVKPVRGVEGE